MVGSTPEDIAMSARDEELANLLANATDAALRAGLAVEVAGNGDPVAPIVPFALDELEIRHPLTETCYAHVVRSRDALATALPAGLVSSTDATAYKYDIVVTDADGRVLVKLHGFSGRALVRQAAPTRAVQFFDDQWLPTPLAQTAVASRAARTVLVVADDLDRAQGLVHALPEGDLYYVGRILHDWSEANIERLLLRIFERLPEGGALAIMPRGSPMADATVMAWLSPGSPIRRWYVGRRVCVSKSTLALSTRSWLKAYALRMPRCVVTMARQPK